MQLFPGIILILHLRDKCTGEHHPDRQNGQRHKLPDLKKVLPPDIRARIGIDAALVFDKPRQKNQRDKGPANQT